ncbi:MAG: DUF4230 domain-containing protein [Kiritimatiellae bacterium]|nr:DUF4230 domain-containing protein [Kiritimatiellia bacterium]
MSTTLALVVLSLLCGLLLALLLLSLRRGKNARAAGSAARETETHVSLEELRQVGELTVLKAVTKEIVTAKDHAFGKVGAKYLQWLVTSRKMAMIFAFDIDFRYDLRSAAFRAEALGGGKARITLPEMETRILIRDISFYDEQAGKILPLLVPEVVSNLLGGGFSEEERNRLLEDARGEAEKLAKRLARSLQSEARSSAKETLKLLAKGLGAEEVEIAFADATAALAAPAATAAE